MKHFRHMPLLPVVAAGAIIATSGCSRKVADTADTSAPRQSEPSVVIGAGADRGAIIASERRFDRNIVRDSAAQAPVSFGRPVAGSAPVQAMACAVAYRMSGPYADHVAIALNSDGTILSYPDPRDITANSAPVALSDGWYLSRSGITASSVFLRYTLAEYAALPAAPTHEELLRAVIPGARVTALERLPFTPAEALADPAAVVRRRPGS